MDAIVEEVLHRDGVPSRVRDAVPELQGLRLPVYEPPGGRVAREGPAAGSVRAEEEAVLAEVPYLLWVEGGGYIGWEAKV